MGIGLVDPILPAISQDLNATPSQVTLLFTSYLMITAVAMLITGWVSSRIGAKRTLLVGLALIVVFAALAGASDSIGGIVGFRAGWGVGNALFIATSLAVIVASATGGFVGAIILYETALGLGIAVGPLLGGLLGNVSWRGPFYVASGALLLGIVILRTAHTQLDAAERAQTETVAPPITMELATALGGTGNGVIVAAVDDSPVASRVTDTAGRLAAVNGRAVHVLHAQEHATTTESGASGEAIQAAEALVRDHLARLAAAGVPAVGHVLLNAADHGAVGRLVSAHADELHARAVVIGAPTHGGLPALMDASASRELWRTVHCDVVIVNPVAVADEQDRVSVHT